MTVFRAAADLGSFAAAARSLGLSAAAISKNVSELESHLAVRLFHRTTRRMSLTDEGVRYYATVARVLDDIAEADAELGAACQSPRGHLKVSAPMTVTLTALSREVPKFLESNPEISLELHLDDRRVDLVGGGYDLAIRGSDRLEDSTLVARRLITLDHVLCAAPRYLARAGTPKAPEELADHVLVRFSHSDHSDEWELRNDERAVSVPVRAAYSVGSSIAVRDALVEGYGLSLIPKLYVLDQLASGALVPLLEGWTGNDTTVYAVYPSRRFLVPRVRAFVDFLMRVFAELPA